MVSVAKNDKRKTLDDIVAYYDQTRSDYGILWFRPDNRSVHFGYYEPGVTRHADALLNMNRQLADRAGIQAGAQVLDAGCGQGGSAVWLAQQRNALVVGITPVATQIADAQKFIRLRHVQDRVTVQLGDYQAMVFPDASFDVVWMCESLCHADDKGKVYAEAFRVLRPGGRLIVAEYMRTDDGPAAADLLRQWLHGWSINWIDSPAEHRDQATRAGFVAVTIDDVTSNTEPSLKLLHRLATWLMPLETVLQRLRLRTTVQRGNIVGSLCQYEALQKGYWCYGILRAEKPG